MIEKFRHIIWDWNGTLLNDVDLSLSIINKILTNRGIKELSLEGYRNIFTFPVRNYYEFAGINLKKYSFEEVGKEWIEEYEKRRLECRLFNGAEQVLNSTLEKTGGQSILSAYSQSSLEEIILHFELNMYFTYLTGLDHIYATGKKDLAKSLLKRLKIDREKILLVGDTIHDYEVASETGIKCVLISNGHQSRERLLECKVPVLNNLTELLDY